MYGDTKTSKDRMKKGGSASAKNLLGKMSSAKHSASKTAEMVKTIAKAKAKKK